MYSRNFKLNSDVMTSILSCTTFQWTKRIFLWIFCDFFLICEKLWIRLIGILFSLKFKSSFIHKLYQWNVHIATNAYTIFCSIYVLVTVKWLQNLYLCGVITTFFFLANYCCFFCFVFFTTLVVCYTYSYVASTSCKAIKWNYI